ncbi:MAG: gliding motility protein GldL [Bacteroides sp.]
MTNNKKNSFTRKLQDFMASYNGKVILNYAYSWGASVVILGALFKLTHLPGANFMLFAGMGTEVLVFFISAFDRPYKSYKWESVFPSIKISGADYGKKEENQTDELDNNLKNAATVAAFAAQAGNHGGNVVGNTGSGVVINSTPNDETIPMGGSPAVGGTYIIGGNSVGSGISAEAAANSPEVADATELYLSQLQGMTDTLKRFNEATNSLTQVSDTLLDSYKSITDNSDDITTNSKGYVQQMESLNRNLSGLNTIYEIQLKSISSQIDTIDKVNVGLNRIREMYEGSTDNSQKFNEEAEKMAQQIEELNAVYARMLQAMTVNIK